MIEKTRKIDWKYVDLDNWNFDNALTQRRKKSLLKDALPALKDALEEVTNFVWNEAAIEGAKTAIEEVTSLDNQIELFINAPDDFQLEFSMLESVIIIRRNLEQVLKSPHFEKIGDLKALAAKLREIADYLDKRIK